VPGAQKKQADDPSVENVPCVHTTQNVLPVLFWCSPAGQFVQAVALVTYPKVNLPLAHWVQAEALVKENAPGPQFVQAVEAGGENFPPGHAEQNDEAFKRVKYPASQARHEVMPRSDAK
jgi:hypothetical protein